MRIAKLIVSEKLYAVEGPGGGGEFAVFIHFVNLDGGGGRVIRVYHCCRLLLLVSCGGLGYALHFKDTFACLFMNMIQSGRRPRTPLSLFKTQ